MDYDKNLLNKYEKDWINSYHRTVFNNLKKNNFLTLSDKNIYDVIPYICSANMYVGNDSFGSHITSQSGKKSLVFLLDAPRAYTAVS